MRQVYPHIGGVARSGIYPEVSLCCFLGGVLTLSRRSERIHLPGSRICTHAAKQRPRRGERSPHWSALDCKMNAGSRSSASPEVPEICSLIDGGERCLSRATAAKYSKRLLKDIPPRRPQFYPDPEVGHCFDLESRSAATSRPSTIHTQTSRPGSLRVYCAWSACCVIQRKLDN